MNMQDMIKNEKVNVNGIPSSYFLIGVISAFENRFQSMADREMKEISWKQFFAIICINMCKESPTIKELSEVLGSSHQNVKQILLKLESKGFVEFKVDENDKRKQRIFLTKACMDFCNKNNDLSMSAMGQMFEGIPEKDIKTTIKTLLSIESNMRQRMESLN